MRGNGFIERCSGCSSSLQAKAMQVVPESSLLRETNRRWLLAREERGSICVGEASVGLKLPEYLLATRNIQCRDFVFREGGRAIIPGGPLSYFFFVRLPEFIGRK